MSAGEVKKLSTYDQQIAKAVELSLVPQQTAPSEKNTGDREARAVKAAIEAVKKLEENKGKAEKAEVPSAHKAPPIVDKVTTFKEFAKTQTKDSEVRIGLEKLDKDYLLQKIKGDGHCCFRATAVFVVKKWMRLSALG